MTRNENSMTGYDAFCPEACDLRIFLFYLCWDPIIKVIMMKNSLHLHLDSFHRDSFFFSVFSCLLGPLSLKPYIFSMYTPLVWTGPYHFLLPSMARACFLFLVLDYMFSVRLTTTALRNSKYTTTFYSFVSCVGLCMCTFTRILFLELRVVSEVCWCRYDGHDWIGVLAGCHWPLRGRM
ncbi:uncharacterized protein BO66DRAFT_226677 [Aspergillus aculeatinus CBS 121060]|uniref:Uncharacterized protein n=1 Tax=Aspergillus aculeatinus CBS 121060 TaxID=1448322 RepID=A0ACD1GUA7_9EURO|nr:hypothetical protein BO66DRAFT_226677 [Aspergillus aculeatinus CBS 121060]RAH64943.1 hypothetical protein BO66DRAFT_226677 [Aspergillus aculeatinus CBS 121060]